MKSKDMMPSTGTTKKYTTTQIREQRRHELTLSVMDACARNPDLPLLMMVVGGAATAVTAAALEKLTEAKTETEKRDATQEYVDTLTNLLISGASGVGFLSGGLLGKAALETITGQMTGEKRPQNWIEFSTQGVVIGATSLAASALGLLYVRAIFGGQSNSNGAVSSIMPGVL